MRVGPDYVDIPVSVRSVESSPHKILIQERSVRIVPKGILRESELTPKLVDTFVCPALDAHHAVSSRLLSGWH